MRRFSSVWLAGRALLLSVAAACGRPGAPPRPGDAALGQDRITLERGPCFGTCPVYTVELDRSGAVTFEGRRFVADSGTSTDSIPAARADSLFRELEAGGWFDLSDRYHIGGSGCGRSATDMPTVITEVRMGGRTNRIEHYHGCTDAPAKLYAFEQRIDEVAGVRRWVGK